MKSQGLRKGKIGIGLKLGGGLSVIILIFIISCAAASVRLNSLKKGLDKIVDVSSKRQLLAAQINRDIVKIHRAEKNIIAETKPEEMDRYAEALDEYESEILDRIDSLDAIATPEGKEGINAFRKTYNSWKEINQKVRRLSWQADNIEAMELSSGQGRILLDRLEDGLTEIVDRNEIDMISDKRVSDASYRAANIFLWALLISAILSALALSIIVYRSVTIPVKKLKFAAEEIGKGRLNTGIDLSSSDEIGDLAVSFRNMAEELKKHRSHLEELVSKRTADLVRVNKELECEITEHKEAEKALKAAHQQLMASEQQLKASNQQLRAHEQQLRASNEQLRASEQQLRAANQQLSASGQQLRDEITVRKKAEEEIIESESKFKAIFNSASDGIVLADMETKKFFMANAAFCKMLGYNPEEISKIGLMDIHREEETSYNLEQFDKLSKKLKVFVTDIAVRRKDGSIFIADIAGSPVRIGAKNYLMGFFRDTTERKAMEKSQRLAELGKLVADMAHEVNNPLMIISGNAQLSLLDEKLNEEVKNNLKIIHEECNRAKD
ncbi:MAG: PAS domain S-box protein, partial [Candidatus Omnitrophota bacterium]